MSNNSLLINAINIFKSDQICTGYVMLDQADPLCFATGIAQSPQLGLMLCMIKFAHISPRSSIYNITGLNIDTSLGRFKQSLS